LTSPKAAGRTTIVGKKLVVILGQKKAVAVWPERVRAAAMVESAGVVRDTVLVPPGRRVVVAFDANNPGLWAIHCHLLYHLDAGMFTTLRYV
jgi:FtsP/CotA-like multicopper oxidase with cupredoxin domain